MKNELDFALFCSASFVVYFSSQRSLTHCRFIAVAFPQGLSVPYEERERI